MNQTETICVQKPATEVIVGNALFFNQNFGTFKLSVIFTNFHFEIKQTKWNNLKDKKLLKFYNISLNKSNRNYKISKFHYSSLVEKGIDNPS